MNANDEYQLVTPEEMARSLADRLQQLRLMRAWKQSSLARRAGISPASLRRFEQTGGSPGGVRPKILVGLKGDELITAPDPLPEGYHGWLGKMR